MDLLAGIPAARAFRVDTSRHFPFLAPGRFAFTRRPDAAPLPAGRERGLALGASFAVADGAPVNTLSLVPAEPPATGEADPADSARARAAVEWDATDADGARAVCSGLLEGSRQQLYSLVTAHAVLVSRDRTRRAREYEEALAEGRRQAAAAGIKPNAFERALQTWVGKTYYPLPGHLPASAQGEVTSVQAFDAAQVVQASRLFLDAGLLDEDEVWGWIEAAGQSCKAVYASWAQFNDGLLVGRIFASCTEQLASRKRAAQRVNPLATAGWRLLHIEGSPWLGTTW